MERAQVSRRKAEHYIKDLDAGRREFIRRHFHKDITNPELHDIVIDTSTCTCNDAVDTIVSRWHERFGSPSNGPRYE